TFGALLGHRHEKTIAQFGIPAPQRNASEKTSATGFIEHLVDSARRIAKHEFFERRTPEGWRQSCALCELLDRVMAFLQTKIRRFTKSLWTHRCEIHGGAKSEQSLVGANVTCGLFTANVLLARLQSQHEAALAIAVDGFAGDPPWHATHEFFATSDNSQIGAAELHLSAERLPFSDHDICTVIPRPFQQSQADRIDRNNEKRAMIVGSLRQPLDLFQTAKKVRVLHEHARRVVIDRCSEL